MRFSIGPASQPGAEPSPPPPEGQFEKIGVPECDDYAARFVRCIYMKVPAGVIPQMLSAFRQMISAWRKAAETPEGRAGLATGCRKASEAAAKVLTGYGCVW